ncbi:pyruvate dehydrogenase E2 component (dihydrolipoamide acetyltransferase) [Actinopolymorpha cephalotaxi]|uniref:Dihydrolipoamide acetyltransferase component of pyruvate dehydrogenase complex n=1 Tax=Actinopolymorpha cephalotaxi TaxID=504797 RepID=A0A1I3BI45_9ACTN|nr:dihydrolipoamide acetyltransferase family protein [Actinopolymorpha cephalotaxi]NYH86401.1 pyruvate dehydrogenase E2 component (dihydrolipoamide acetyltransferase) [Actinopolymorpha cephalotaxi]SFH61948.1 pyruvate dehydrogenase E2 component (dihydrolipoamide acetyltransferase) [Actinopolymorpha cephalotaxi]
MTEAREFRLPDVGEGLVEAEIVSWRVKPGDEVKVNDVVVEIETAKSLVELPCPYAGTIAELLVPEGQVVPVGTPIIRVAAPGAAVAPGSAAAGAPAAEAAPAASAPQAAEAAVAGSFDVAAGTPGATTEKAAAADEQKTSMLVGYGPRTTSARRRPRTTTAAPAPAASAPAAPAVPAAPPVPATPAPAPAPAAPTSPGVLAKPPVRKLAKDLGVDLNQVPRTGPNGTVTRADVEAFAAGTTAAAPADVTPAEPVQAAVSAGAGDTRIPVRGVRRATAQAVTQSAFTAPHVTEWVSVDATATMELLDRLRARRDFADVRLSPLVVVAKACLLALRRTPELNATWDEPAGEIVLKHHVNLGIAAATPRGLMVPHVKNADRMPLVDLARSLTELTQTARAGKTQPADMLGTTFTITNVGVFGVDGGTPILNPGESGILAVGAIRKQPWVVDDEVVPRWVATLSLSFDHRIVDGEQGSRFLMDVASVLEDPASALLLA